MKKVLIMLAVAAAAVTSFAANKGSCEAAAAAASLGKTQTVKLTKEYDPDFKEYSESGVYYLAVNLSRGVAYTFVHNGGDSVMVDIYPRDSTDAEFDRGIYAPFVMFEDGGEFDGLSVQYLYADSWDAADPTSWKFYIAISGDVGTSVSFSLTTGITPYATPGTEDNPTRLTMADKAASQSFTFVDDGTYYFTSSLRAGRLYRVRTTGGTAANPVALDVESNVEYDLIDDPAYASDTNNTAVIIAPAANGEFILAAGGTGATFGLVWQAIPTRAITAHPSTALNAANGYSARFIPGRTISSYNYADAIIDEHLCSIALAKGERWVFDTEGATVESRMVLYDSKGNVLASNMTAGNSSYNVRIGYEATAAGTYYVGVCEPILGVGDAPTGSEIVLTASKVAPVDGDPDEWDATDDVPTGATPLSPLPGKESSNPVSDGAAHGPHRLGITDWADCYQIGVRKGITYVLTAVQTGEAKTDLKLAAEVFTLSGTRETKVAFTGGIDPMDEEPLTFTPSANGTYYIRVTVSEGKGLDYPDYTVYAMAYATDGSDLGILTVKTPGAPSATWTIDKETVKYSAGASLLIGGAHTVKFSSVKGYKAEKSSVSVDVKPGSEPTVVVVNYTDTYDPKDDVASGASSITFKNVETEYAARTLWKGDVDVFTFAGTDGYFYDIALKNVEGDDVTFTISNAETGFLVENVPSVKQIAMPKTKTKYLLTVKNGAGATSFGGYSLSGKFANVGAIKFEKATLSVKEDAATATVKVKRTAKDGYVRVKYGTVAGTAKPGVDYIAQNGVLEWANGDNKDKTIAIALIPDLLPVYEGNKTFTIQLKAFDEEDRLPDEQPVAFAGDKCVVTLTETSKSGTKAADAYAKSKPKLATVKTETVPLETGTFYGVVAEDGSALTNGMPQLASVTFTATEAKGKTPASLSAKVALAGKTYSFSAKGWDDDAGEGQFRKEFTLAQKVNRIDEETGKSVSVQVTNTLVVTVNSGATATAGDWKKAGGTVELVMNVPDDNNKGYQEEIRYTGEIYRNNAKIQDYLTAVTNFTGYYTVALSTSGVSFSDGIPAGNGYLTLTIDNKGKVKVAGQLADGTTKPSLSVTACALVPDEESANGYSMFVPIYLAKKPAVFGGTLRLYADATGKVVVDSAAQLVWNNDNAKLTYSGEEGYRLLVDPVGGWYDTVINLQAYYLNYLFEVGTADIEEFPKEIVAAGFSIVAGVEPNATAVSIAGNAFSTAKKSLVKDGKLYDLASSVNPCNVQVKLARATGIVTGTFSVWSAKDDGSAQKEITGFKHNGVLLLSRDAASPLSEDVMSAGFFTGSAKLSEVNPTTKKTSTRTWTFSLPFNLIGIDQGDQDWWADDWGEME